MKKYNKKFLAVPGFKLHGIHTGVKKSRRDLGIIYTDNGVSAGVFTQNISVAAPVTISKKHLENQITKAILINSGNANACTGKLGFDNAKESIKVLAKELQIKEEEILISSTGIIGKQLEMDKILPSIPKLCEELSSTSYDNFPESITTTDSFNKLCSCELLIDGELITVSGVAKGSGMIHPNMATMLGFIQTDVNISKNMLQEIVSYVVNDTFNMISVDGDTSTNDMVLSLSSNLANNKIVNDKTKDYYKLQEAFLFVCKKLAISIAMDGEGSTKLIECNILNSKSDLDARLMAKSIVKSSLVKTAVFGKDANWGRILCAMGYSGGSFDPEKINLTIKSKVGEILLMNEGCGVNFDEMKALKILNEDKLVIEVDAKEGNNSATAWGCDLTYDYVKINAEYRT